jgi:isopenicillin N synthase-like dioxygenase
MIAQTEPNLAKATQLETPLAFWKQWQDVVGRCILPALAQAIGSSDILNDVAYNYRMVDYYNYNDDIDKTNHHDHDDDDDASIAPRCGEHRDFGSFTMIQANQPGLQVFVENEWHTLDTIPEGSALMVFGWCTQIRSNGRIPAVLHRVEQDHRQQQHAANNHRRRLAAVLFCAPKMVDTALEPVVRPGEVRKYISGVKVGQLRGQMARKWQKREGTLTKEAYILEEAEIMATPQLQTQDDVIERTVKV